MERRLAAILAADVVGYSRLIGADEAGTLNALRTLLKEVVEPTLKSHRGRIVKLMGDGLLAEFASVVDAVTAAVEIQEATPGRSAHLPEDRRIALRVGVNIGDVAVEDGDLFGNGVNVAARLQEIAVPNGVAISADTHRQLRGKLDLPFVDAGDKALKNIEEPVHTWLWSPTPTRSIAQESNKKLALPDKPSIAVLPFANMSGDPEQEYFADGMTEDIITGLSRFRSLFVIARNSTFAYKGKSPDVREVARDLGVRYVLEGSVRKGGERIRITGQLIDAEMGNHLWAERYDRNLEDIFEIEDEVTEAIVAAIAPEIDEVERQRALRNRPENLDAWGLYHRAMLHNLEFTAAGRAEAIQFLHQAIDRDPSFAPAHAAAARILQNGVFFGDFEDSKQALDMALDMARNSVQLDRRDALTHSALGRVHARRGEFAAAIRDFDAAIALNPNLTEAYSGLGFALYYAGRQTDALPHVQTALRLDPNSPMIWSMHHLAARCYLDLHLYEKAYDSAQRATSYRNAPLVAYAVLAASAAMFGKQDEARAAVEEILRKDSNVTLRFAMQKFGSEQTRAALEHFVEALRKAGLPE